MASYQLILLDGSLGPPTRFTKTGGPFNDGIELANRNFHYNFDTDRVDPNYMDADWTAAIPNNLPFFGMPLIPWHQMSLTNLPPWGHRLSDNQAVQIMIWTETKARADKKNECMPSKWLAYYWPSDFETDGYLSANRASLAPQWDGNYGPTQNRNVNMWFKEANKTPQNEQDCRRRLRGENAGPVILADNYWLDFRPTFRSHGLKMDIGGVLDFARNIPEGYTFWGRPVSRNQLLGWLHTALSTSKLIELPAPAVSPFSVEAANPTRNLLDPNDPPTLEQLCGFIKQLWGHNKQLREFNKKLLESNKKLLEEREKLDQSIRELSQSVADLAPPANLPAGPLEMMLARYPVPDPHAPDVVTREMILPHIRNIVDQVTREFDANQDHPMLDTPINENDAGNGGGAVNQTGAVNQLAVANQSAAAVQLSGVNQDGARGSNVAASRRRTLDDVARTEREDRSNTRRRTGPGPGSEGSTESSSAVSRHSPALRDIPRRVWSSIIGPRRGRGSGNGGRNGANQGQVGNASRTSIIPQSASIRRAVPGLNHSSSAPAASRPAASRPSSRANQSGRPAGSSVENPMELDD